MNYKHYNNRPDKITSEFVQQEFDGLIARLEHAENSQVAEQWIEIFRDWNALKSYLSGTGSRIGYAVSKDANDLEADAAEEYFREKIGPISDKGNSILVRALLRSKHKNAVGEVFGTHLIKVLEVAEKSIDPINSELKIKEGALVNKYNKLIASGEVEVSGEKLTLAVARSRQSSADPNVRKEAFINYRSWFLNNRSEITTIYNDLVAIRHQMALNLGFENFVPLGYLNMGRTDYSPVEAKQFRDAVRKYVVPLQSILLERHAKELGTPTVKCWDTEYCPSCTLPEGVAPVNSQLDNAEKVFDALDKRLGDHFRRMRNENLIDLENRKGKRAGAFCTSFSDEGRVAIFCNSTGNQDDVGTLMHEMGHAFQGWESQSIEAVDLQWPTSDACEIHSMGMEYLALQHLTNFFTHEQTLQFSRGRWREAIGLMTYICIVDEFQHWVYENYNSTIDERDAAWVRIWKSYKPDVDYSDNEDLIFARWYAQIHIFDYPFYYIDYALAETGAMQLAILDTQNHKETLDKYIKLCQIGGTKSVLDIFKAVDLASPFDETNMKKIMDYAAKFLNFQNN